MSLEEKLNNLENKKVEKKKNPRREEDKKTLWKIGIAGAVLLFILVKACSKPDACECIPLLGNRMLGTMDEQKACRKAYVSYNDAARECAGK